MEASRVAVSPAHLSKSLSKKRKRELRQERIIELIRSKPSGAQIKLSEFAAVADAHVGSVYKILQNMASDGLINIVRLSPHELTYHVLSDHPKDEWKTGKQPHRESERSDVVELARQYFWEVQDDSLHNFVEWVAKHKERG